MIWLSRFFSNSHSGTFFLSAFIKNKGSESEKNILKFRKDEMRWNEKLATSSESRNEWNSSYAITFTFHTHAIDKHILKTEKKITHIGRLDLPYKYAPHIIMFYGNFSMFITAWLLLLLLHL